jgi:hypothetical protein
MTRSKREPCFGMQEQRFFVLEILWSKRMGTLEDPNFRSYAIAAFYISVAT